MAETENQAGGPSKGPKAKKAAKGNVPTADSNLGTTTSSVSKKWLTKPEITLVWIKAVDFKTKGDLFISSIDQRKESGALRPEITKNLTTVNEKLDLGVKFIKNYLAADFGDDAKAQFSKFGIVKSSTGYNLPKDRDKRQDSLKLMLPAIAASGYDAKPYGKAYFTPLITEFNTLAGSARTSDENISGHVGNKNELKAEVKLVLTSLIKVLQGNYPKTWKTVLREWGFQKEKY